MASDESPNVGGYYKGMLIINIVMLFVAMANLAIGIANAVICGFLGSIGYGIWGSVLCFIASISGIVASQSRKTGTIMTHMVFAILAGVSAAVQLAMGTNAAVVDFFQIQGYFYNTADDMSSWQYRFFYYEGCSGTQRESYATGANGPTVTDALLASFAILQGIFAIVSAAFCCRATVCPPGVDHMPWEGSQQRLVAKA